MRFLASPRWYRYGHVRALVWCSSAAASMVPDPKATGRSTCIISGSQSESQLRHDPALNDIAEDVVLDATVREVRTLHQPGKPIALEVEAGACADEPEPVGPALDRQHVGPEGPIRIAG